MNLAGRFQCRAGPRPEGPTANSPGRKPGVKDRRTRSPEAEGATEMPIAPSIVQYGAYHNMLGGATYCTITVCAILTS